MPQTRRRIVVDDSALAGSIGGRIRAARKRANLTQQQLAEGRYTKAYVSALEKGLAKPSMAALNFFAGRLGISARQLVGEDTPTWTRLEADLLLASERWGEAATAYQDVLAATTDPVVRAEILQGLAEALCRLDRPSEAVGPASEAAELFTRFSRPADAVVANYWLSFAHHQLQNGAEAAGLLHSILAQIRDGLTVAPDLRVRVLVALAVSAIRDGDHRPALAYLEEAKGISVDLDDRRRATYLFSLAAAYRQAGDLEAAIRSGLQSLALFKASEADLEAGIMQAHLALAYLGLGNTARASELVEEARNRFNALGARRELPHLIETEAQIALASDAPDRALELAQQAMDLAEELENPKARLSALITAARALAAKGELDRADETYARAAEVARGGAPARVREVLEDWADVLARLGRHDRAYALTKEALQANRVG